MDKDLETRTEVNHDQRAHTRKQHAFRLYKTTGKREFRDFGFQ